MKVQISVTTTIDTKDLPIKMTLKQLKESNYDIYLIPCNEIYEKSGYCPIDLDLIGGYDKRTIKEVK